MRGVFGSTAVPPIARVGPRREASPKKFWGNDRFELANAWIQKANGSPGVGRRAALP
jgi:hypothetical protein